jgi:hypothetical protein
MRARNLRTTVIPGAALIALFAMHAAVAQMRAPPPPGPPPPAKQDAPIDLTGTWVSIVNEDWRWRMVTPPKGDYASVPLSAEGKKVADTWDASQDGSCKAYGVGGLMRMPTRVRISWESDVVLRIESDAGQQLRRLFFKQDALPPAGGKTLQGRSLATWEHSKPAGTGMGFPSRAARAPGGSLSVVTTDVQSGWVRRNGVAYSDAAVVKEFFDRFPTPDGNEWFVVTTIVEDPWFAQPYITSSHFRREPDGSKWRPTRCKG